MAKKDPRLETSPTPAPRPIDDRFAAVADEISIVDKPIEKPEPKPKPKKIDKAALKRRREMEARWLAWEIYEDLWLGADAKDAVRILQDLVGVLVDRLPEIRSVRESELVAAEACITQEIDALEERESVYKKGTPNYEKKKRSSDMPRCSKLVNKWMKPGQDVPLYCSLRYCFVCGIRHPLGMCEEAK